MHIVVVRRAAGAASKLAFPWVRGQNKDTSPVLGAPAPWQAIGCSLPAGSLLSCVQQCVSFQIQDLPLNDN